MAKKILKDVYVKQIIDNPELQGKIAGASNRSFASVIRWANSNHEMLTHTSVLDAISEYKGVPVSELIEEIAEKKKAKQLAAAK